VRVDIRNWRKAVSYVFPEAPILLGALLYTHVPWLHRALGGFETFYAYAIFGAGLLLGWRFQRSRLLLALLVVAVADRTLVQLALDQELGRNHVVFQAIGVLLPLNLAALALTAERGLVTLAGLARLALIGVQVAGVAQLDRAVPGATAAVLHFNLLPPTLMAWTPLADPALFAFLLAFGLQVAGQVMSPTSTQRSYLWVTAAVFLGLNDLRPGSPDSMTFYLATACLILIAHVVEASHHMAYQDTLTGLPARRALNEALLRLRGHYTVAMADVDHFKKINDQHGHDVGDQVLKMVAAKLARVGGGGRAFRYGGEEFAVLFPGTAVQECLQELETLRRTVQDSTFILRRRLRSPARRKQATPLPIVAEKGPGKRVQVTISIGVADKNPRHTEPDQVIQAADRALYRAKEGGRNQVKT
jgi:GGDEF domain-containing protein